MPQIQCGIACFINLKERIVSNMEYYDVLLPLAIILGLSKVLVKICERFSLPRVVGMLLAGVAVGLIRLIPGETVLNGTAVEGLGFIAKIGVILIMFSAGLETDVKQIKSVGIPAVIITTAGVVVPMGLGFLTACLFNGGFAKENLLTNLFYGVILTATSVSVTVATLKELGQLSTKLGSTIVAAAVLDDIIGVVVLSFTVAMKGTAGAEVVNPWIVLLKTVLFFIFVIVVGFGCKKLFDVIERRYPHHRMLPVFSLALCFFFSYASERWFGVADITGAFAAGLVLSGNRESDYIDRRSDIISYMIFTPVFFANIGINANFSGLTGDALLFGAMFILAGIVGKVIGCGSLAKICGYSGIDSFRIGLGMMARAEVALVCAQKGVDSGIIGSEIMPFILILIVVTSFVTPIALKATYKNRIPANAG